MASTSKSVKRKRNQINNNKDVEQDNDESFMTSMVNEEESSDEDDQSDEDEGYNQSDEDGNETGEEESNEENEDEESNSEFEEENGKELSFVEDDSSEELSFDEEVSENESKQVNHSVSKEEIKPAKKGKNKKSSFEKKKLKNKGKSIIKKWEVVANKDVVQPNGISSKTQGKKSQNKKEEEEEEYTSDEEEIRNTVGNIPMNWYDDYPHIGYDWDGNMLMKGKKMDELDQFLKKMEDPDFWRTVTDPQTGQDVVLNEEDVDQISRIQKRKIPDPNYDEYAPWIEWFSSVVMKTPVCEVPTHKRSFLPSISDQKRISKYVHAMKMGWMKPPQKEPEEKPEKQFYMIWQEDNVAEPMRRIEKHVPAPKKFLPKHAESYNPPEEYLFNKHEEAIWNKLEHIPWKRKLHFHPEKYNSLREVPVYERYVRERFNRCMDLYLAPRAIKRKLRIDPEDLLPELPESKDLQPFPTVMSMIYKGHTDIVRTITVEPVKGQYIISGSDDFTIKIWEVSTGRCVRTVQCGGTVRCVSWCPSTALCLVAVAADRKLLLINPMVGDHVVVSKTDELLLEAPPEDYLVHFRVSAAVQWEQATGEDWEKGVRIIINHFKEIANVSWHGRGDYLAAVMPEGLNRSVLIHQISKRRSQLPFNRSKGLIQCVLFHPVRPYFFVATQRIIRIYDLAKQELVKKLKSSSKWISSMAIHSGGDNLLVGTYDSQVLWFDLDLSTSPYQKLRLHKEAVRGVAYHKRYPLFASVSDDLSCIVSHGMIYNDLLKNPLIVPLKRLSNHRRTNDFGVFGVMFHPSQPWVFTSGADSTIRLYT